MVFWQLILIQVVTFGLLVFLLRQFLYQHVTRSQERLEQLVQENRKREEELKTRQEETEKELQARVAQQNEEGGRLRAAAEVDAQKMQEEMVAKAKEEGKKIVAEAEAKREQMRANLVSEMEHKALDLASNIIGHIFTARVARGIHEQLTDELIEEIGKSDGQRMQLNVETAEITAPYPLTQVQEENLKNILSAKMGRPVSIKGTIDQEMMAGMVVRLENLVLDGSLKNKLKGTLAYVRSNLAS